MCITVNIEMYYFIYNVVVLNIAQPDVELCLNLLALSSGLCITEPS